MPLVDEKVKLRLLVGHRCLLAAQYKHTFACLNTLQTHCRAVNTCKISLREAQRFLHTPGLSGNVIVRPFVTLKDFNGLKVNFCDECGSVMTAGLEAGAAKVWRLLPWAFGLGSWEELITETNSKEGEGESNEATNDH